MSGENGSAPADLHLDDIRVEGTSQLELFVLGGKLPTGAKLTLVGGAVDLVQGEAFRKGDRLRIVLDAVVNDVAQKDHHDSKTGQVTSCTQSHKARIVDMQVESATAAE